MLAAADEQLLKELTERARTGGVKLTGEGGLLGKLTKMVAGGALEGEHTDRHSASWSTVCHGVSVPPQSKMTARTATFPILEVPSIPLPPSLSPNGSSHW